MTDLVRFSGATVDRRTGRVLDQLDRRAQLVRGADRANAVRTAQRMSDLRTLTTHALNSAVSIGIELEIAAAQAPAIQQGLVSIAATGIQGLQQQLRDYADPFA